MMFGNDEEELPALELILDISQVYPRSEMNTIPVATISDGRNNFESTPLIATIRPRVTSARMIFNQRSPSGCFARHVDAEYPDYITLASRLSTYGDWINTNISSTALAEAGFYYTNKLDIVACFHCGVHICDWLSAENPWVSHAKFSPWCTFIYIRCGKSFIDSCLKNEPIQTQDSSLVEPTDSRYTCKVCLEKEIGACFYPCDHCVTCIKCAPGIASCPICRAEIKGVFRLKLIE